MLQALQIFPNALAERQKATEMRFRALISTVTSTSFLAMAVSGFVAFFVPHGRIAYWTDWKFLGLSKTNWADLHVASSFLFFLVAVFHIYLNWRPLKAYVARKLPRAPEFPVELSTSIVLVCVLMLTAVWRMPPTSYLLDFGDKLKESWVVREFEPPFGRAELLDMRSFCQKTNIGLDLALAELEVHGIKVGSPGLSVQSIAKANNVSPLNIYMLIKHLELKQSSIDKGTPLTPEFLEAQYSGSGIGRKKIQDIIKTHSLDPKNTEARLSSLNIAFVPDETLKQLAERHGMQSMDMLKILVIPDFKPGEN